MIEVLDQARMTYSYGFELWQDRAHFQDLLGQVTDQAGVNHIARAQTPLGVSGMGLLSKMAYDLSVTTSGAEASVRRRTEAADIGCMALLAADLVDDEIDRAGVPVEEKFRCLDLWLECLVTGRDTMDSDNYPQGTQPAGIRVSQAVGRFLHNAASENGKLDALVDVNDRLFVSLKSQISSSDLEEQLELIPKIGVGCGELSAVAVDIVTDKEHPQVTTAFGALGAYAECINHGSEIIENQREGSASYTNLLFAREGYSLSRHRVARQTLYQTAELVFSESVRELSDAGRQIILVGKRLMDIKYKLLGKRVKPSLS